jgi:hypothetical protein
MAETAIALATTIASAASSAASAIAPVASAVGTAASVAAPFVGVASSLASARLQVSGSQQQAQALGMQANQQDLLAQQEQLRGQEQSNQVREALLRTLATQRAQYAAAGIALDEGTPETVAEASRYEAERELAIGRGNTAIAVSNARTNAQLLRDRASAGLRSSGLSAGVSLFDTVDRLGARTPGRVSAERTGTAGAARGTP